MKKLFAIMMALVMCCTLVISASATSIDNEYYSLDLSLDGEWYDDGEWAEWETENSYIEITIYSADDYDIIAEYKSMSDEAEAYAASTGNTCQFTSGELDGCPMFVLIEGSTEIFEGYILVLTDDYACEIEFYSYDSEEFIAIANDIDYMTFTSTFSGDLDNGYGYEEEEIVDEEEEEIVDEEEIVEEEEDEKKPSKDDKDDKDEEDEDEKKDKKDKDEDEDEDEGNNTTIIIIVVAAVAVVAIAVVVIVLTKKK